jgi:hypothetical protein
VAGGVNSGRACCRGRGRWSSGHAPLSEYPCELSRSGGYRRRRRPLRRACWRWRENRSRCRRLRLRERRLEEPRELARRRRRRWRRWRGGLADGLRRRGCLKQLRKLAGRGRRRRRGRCGRRRGGLTHGLRWRGSLEHSGELAWRRPRWWRSRGGWQWRNRRGPPRTGWG